VQSLSQLRVTSLTATGGLSEAISPRTGGLFRSRRQGGHGQPEPGRRGGRLTVDQKLKRTSIRALVGAWNSTNRVPWHLLLIVEGADVHLTGVEGRFIDHDARASRGVVLALGPNPGVHVS